MDDLTLLYYTANKIPETFGNNVRNHLLSLFPEGIPIISISHKPIDFGKNIHVDGFEYSIYNIYKQILIGAREAKTKYIACCEDDALYPREHFEHRPEDDTFDYNINRYLVNKDCFFSPRRVCMCTCISTRKLMIDTLETRFKKYPTIIRDKSILGAFGEPGRSERKLELPPVKLIKFETKIPMLVFNHFPSVGGVRKIKDTAIVTKYLDGWGYANELWNSMDILRWHWKTREENWWNTRDRYENNTGTC